MSAQGSTPKGPGTPLADAGSFLAERESDVKATDGPAGARRHPVGAEVVRDGVSFPVWGPDRRSVAVRVEGGEHPLGAGGDGYFAGLVRDARAGTRYHI